MISQAEKEQFRQHARNCADIQSYHENEYQPDPDVILRFWKENKQKYLYKLLGNQVILSKHITYNQDNESLYEEMKRMLRRNEAFVKKFLDALATATGCDLTQYSRYKLPPNSPLVFYSHVRDMLGYYSLVDGRVPVTISRVIMGKEVQLTCGQKSMRALGRIAGLLGLSKEFEEFRIAHSQVLNQRTIAGDLHLSIHPLDYATASDNANGWTSCMSWQENGCYRLGTVEMMNSPMVLCAYITGHNTLTDIGGGEWNSKKWRAWAIVDKDIIIVNRQYPYLNNDVAVCVIDWIKQLAKDNLGWEYQETQSELCYSSDYNIYFRTNYMYNDTSSGMPGAVGIHMKKDDCNKERVYNFSGPANCMWCGKEIPYDGDEDNANTLCCPSCRGSYICCCCGRTIDEDEVIFAPNGEAYCNECYEDNWTTCDHCMEPVSTEDIIHLDMGVDKELLEQLVTAEGSHSSAYTKYRAWFANKLRLPDYFTTNICKDCLKDLDIDPDTDILQHVEMPYSEYYSLWDEKYNTVTTIDPTKVTFDQAKDVFGFFRDDEDFDGSLTRVWKTMWANHISKLVKSGSIEV